ncbi:enoyl-CoA hydratase/isomerase family protein [Bordetella holmesii]|uniref:Enoyl-CoA hydratase/isomerase family protein n=2 Tax=Bordetella holmesii TaxID=35814 RepID=A0A158M5U1_9BORD|nr:enoyl-CoA hydratase-related protein [Bordetella holmesii]AHV92699.1 enoyl-CoA hydratase/isomerase family protein [Bordetella holmesii ATCC 51541]AIT25099.1 enoyl-CoA hydratase/isomerase family protein [Bordetella holmesii 44057]EWM45662.1 enoyl-CoA hydratase/isomerase family protein [Bordetella holmesii 70147]EWM48864.1 enoyl-CoA hydratase/isomerase family protein [Bordetella holmesii 41130]EWM49786.1 enoyl-CoA hydratase/isomerase family protein [Bordetella holmesii 35009]
MNPQALELPAYETVSTRMHGPHTLLVTLDRAQNGNAINTQMGRDLLDLWSRLTEDAGAVRCVVLTGSGERIFCAGGDLKERNGMSRETWQRQHELFERMYWTLVDLPLPVIAAVNGHAYAGGLEMALSCDFVYASRQARFALTEVTLGIMPGAGGTQNLPRAVGDRRAKEILMTGRPFDAGQALDWGLANALYDPAQVLPAALATAEVIAGNAPLSVRQIKKSVRYGGQMELRTAFRFEIEAYNHLIDTDDRREGVLAFNEKRKPVFTGR